MFYAFNVYNSQDTEKSVGYTFVGITLSRYSNGIETYKGKTASQLVVPIIICYVRNALIVDVCIRVWKTIIVPNTEILMESIYSIR